MMGGHVGRGRIVGVRFGDSVWLVVSLILAAIPLLPTVGLPVFACFTTACLLHLQAVSRGRGFPSGLRWGLLAGNIGCVWWVHQGFVGMEPGVSLFLALFAAKVLEMRNRREYQVSVMLGYFLLFCTVYVTHDLFASFYTGLVFCLLTATLLRSHSLGLLEKGRERHFPPMRAALTMLVQTVPVIILLFLFFPRAPEGFGLQLFRKQTTGMSDRLSPGAVEEVIADGSLAFRVRFVQPETPPPLPHYWRGVVLWNCEGLEWTQGVYEALPVVRLNREERAKLIEHEVVLEPHGERWLLSLDRPYYGPEWSRLQTGHYLISQMPINHRRLYQVFSGQIMEELSPTARKAALAVDWKRVPPRVAELAASLQGTPEEKMAALERYFSKSGFTYTLASGAYSERDGWAMMERFLFERKQGFCSHYAASFSSLMRLAGVPARAIIGYAGGEHNPVGGFFSVYQSDAHAWSEVWLEGKGWVRVDPTRYVPNPSGAGATPEPSRDVAEDAAAFEQEREKAGGTRRWLRRAEYQWAALNYRWTRWVLGYDRDAQRQFIQRLGLRSMTTALAVLVGGVLGAMGLLWLGLQWRNYLKEDPVQRAYRRLCRRLEPVVGARGGSESPRRYLARVLERRPELGETLEPLFEQYELLCYAPWKLADPKVAAQLFREGVGRFSL